MLEKGVRNKIFSIILTTVKLGLLIFSGPAQAFTLNVFPTQSFANIGEKISFIASLNIASGERLPVNYLELEIQGFTNCRFNTNLN